MENLKINSNVVIDGMPKNDPYVSGLNGLTGRIEKIDADKCWIKLDDNPIFKNQTVVIGKNQFKAKE